MSRYEDFLAIHTEIAQLEEFMEHTRKATEAIPYVGRVTPLVQSQIAKLRATFDEPAPPPVEPVKPKAKRGDVDGAVRNALGSEITDYPARDWTAWAKEMGLNRKSVLAAVRRHTEKNKT